MNPSPIAAERRRANLRLGLTLAAIAAGFFILIIAKKVFFG